MCLSGGTQRPDWDKLSEIAVSNAFRLCAYPAGPRQGGGRNPSHSVSNAFRLCAYPAAALSAAKASEDDKVSNAFRLCAYPAGVTSLGWHSVQVMRLQCLSAVCLSGGIDALEEGGFTVLVSNAFRLCAYPADREYGGVPSSQVAQSPMPFGCVPIRRLTQTISTIAMK